MEGQAKWRKILVLVAEIIGGAIALWLLGYVVYTFAVI